jgi:hypothetical protein
MTIDDKLFGTISTIKKSLGGIDKIDTQYEELLKCDY